MRTILLALGVALLATPLFSQQAQGQDVNKSVYEPSNTISNRPALERLRSALPRPTVAGPTCQDVTTIVPQLAIGMQDETTEWRTTYSCINRNSDRREATVELFDKGGISLAARALFLNGAESVGQIQFLNLSSNSNVTIALAYCVPPAPFGVCDSKALKTGFMRLTSTAAWSSQLGRCEADIQCSVSFATFGKNGPTGGSGIQIGPPLSSYVVRAVHANNTLVSIAIAKTTHADTTVTLRVFNTRGEGSVPRTPFATKSFVLRDGGSWQVSDVLGNFFKDVPAWQAFMSQWGELVDGSLEIVATDQAGAPALINVTAFLDLRADNGKDWVFSFIPVFPGRDR